MSFLSVEETCACEPLCEESLPGVDFLTVSRWYGNVANLRLIHLKDFIWWESEKKMVDNCNLSAVNSETATFMPAARHESTAV